MTNETLPPPELLAKAGDGDFLRSVVEAVVQLLMKTDVKGLIGAGRHERSGEAHDLPQAMQPSPSRSGSKRRRSPRRPPVSNRLSSLIRWAARVLLSPTQTSIVLSPGRATRNVARPVI